MPLDGTELVLGITRANLLRHTSLTENGFQPPDPMDPDGIRLMADLGELVEFRVRTPELEQDPTFKQFIPYAILCRSGRAWAYRRTRQGTEERLHGRVTVGVGGHVNPCDVHPWNPPGRSTWLRSVLLAGLRRELDEEVGLTEPGEIQFRGFVNEDSSPVGSVHLGVVFTVGVPPDWEPRTEASLLNMGWLSADSVSLGVGAEGWSHMLAHRLPSWLGPLPPSAP